MAHAYTPGLKVLHETRVTKVRRLPMRGEVKVKKGDWVVPSHIVASTHLPGNVRMVNVASLLNVEPGAVPDFMIAKEGTSVEKGNVIAETAGLFGLFKSRAHSPVTGTVESVSSVTGQVVVREPPVAVEIDAYITGLVTEVFPEEGVAIETDAAFVQGIFGIGGEKRGEILALEEGCETVVDEDVITDAMMGKIVVGGAFLTLGGFEKAQELGVRGIVTGGFDYSALKEVLGYTLGVAITGSEDLVTTLVVTEGYGKIPLARRTFDLLKDHDRKEASINGATQIRAGVIRPEVIIPLQKGELKGGYREIDTSTGIEVGSLVRVIRAPYFGALGEVVELPPKLQTLESEAEVRVARVKLDGDSVQTLPRANLELVETD
ncbi:MAG: hypothetical protein ACE5HZ_07840 [Fidelibacterota bacterium]